MNIVIAADIREQSSHRIQAINLYEVFNKAKINVAFLKIGDQIKILEKSEFEILNVNEIKYSIIIALREISSFINIDRSNIVIYLSNTGQIDPGMTYMIHRVDRIIVPNYKAAFNISAAISQMGLSIPIHRVQPWINIQSDRVSDNAQFNILANGPEAIIRSITGYDLTYIGNNKYANWKTSQDPIMSEYSVYVHMKIEDDLMVMKALAAGTVPIVINTIPYTELIIDGLNGFLCTTSDEIMKAIITLENQSARELFRISALRTCHNSLTPENWAHRFIQAANGIGAENLNFGIQTYSPSYRRWIVPKIILQGGKKLLIPRQYNESRFKLVELKTIKEILTYFSMQKFMDVFIFGWEYDSLDEKDNILNLARAIGRRGLNMYWCTDEKIPTEWSDIFNGMAILPTQEGLKKVKPIFQTKVQPKQIT